MVTSFILVAYIQGNYYYKLIHFVLLKIDIFIIFHSFIYIFKRMMPLPHVNNLYNLYDYNFFLFFTKSLSRICWPLGGFLKVTSANQQKILPINYNIVFA